MVMRIGFAGDDFTRNIVRFIAEERLNLAVERPSAVLRVTNLNVPVARGNVPGNLSTTTGADSYVLGGDPAAAEAPATTAASAAKSAKK